MSQPFTELPKPKKKTYAVIVIDITERDGEAFCQHGKPVLNSDGETIMTLACDTFTGGAEEVSLCACCNRWTCDGHMSDKAFRGYLLCKECAELPQYILEEATTFQENLNR